MLISFVSMYSVLFKKFYFCRLLINQEWTFYDNQTLWISLKFIWHHLLETQTAPFLVLYTSAMHVTHNFPIIGEKAESS